MGCKCQRVIYRYQCGHKHKVMDPCDIYRFRREHPYLRFLLCFVGDCNKHAGREERKGVCDKCSEYFAEQYGSHRQTQSAIYCYLKYKERKGWSHLVLEPETVPRHFYLHHSVLNAIEKAGRNQQQARETQQPDRNNSPVRTVTSNANNVPSNQHQQGHDLNKSLPPSPACASTTSKSRPSLNLNRRPPPRPDNRPRQLDLSKPTPTPTPTSAGSTTPGSDCSFTLAAQGKLDDTYLASAATSAVTSPTSPDHLLQERTRAGKQIAGALDNNQRSYNNNNYYYYYQSQSSSRSIDPNDDKAYNSSKTTPFNFSSPPRGHPRHRGGGGGGEPNLPTIFAKIVPLPSPPPNPTLRHTGPAWHCREDLEDELNRRHGGDVVDLFSSPPPPPSPPSVSSEEEEEEEEDGFNDPPFLPNNMNTTPPRVPLMTFDPSSFGERIKFFNSRNNNSDSAAARHVKDSSFHYYYDYDYDNSDDDENDKVCCYYDPEKKKKKEEEEEEDGDDADDDVIIDEEDEDEDDYFGYITIGRGPPM